MALVALAGALAAAPAAAQEMDAHELLQRSIAHHDPQDLWSTGSFRLKIVGTRSLAGPTMTTIVIDNENGRFQYERERWGRIVESTVTGDDCWTRLDGSTELTEQEIQRFGLGCDRMRETRNYNIFLYGLPMKLRDEGTRIEPVARRVELEGRDLWQMRVTYDPEVGTDTWYFFFDPDTYALAAYRFFHDEAAGDGETIILDREVEGGGVLLPKVRAWTRNQDGELLGTDTVQSVERLSRDR